MSNSRNRSPMALSISLPRPLPQLVKRVGAKARKKLGFLPNVLLGYAHVPRRLENFLNTRDELMLSESDLTVLEREMIALVVSATNRCHYCVTSHGATVRSLSGDAILADDLIVNYRFAQLSKRQKSMLDFVFKLTIDPSTIDDSDRDALRVAGFSETAIWDIAEVTGFFNMTNRLANTVGMEPNPEYHQIGR